MYKEIVQNYDFDNDFKSIKIDEESSFLHNYYFLVNHN